MSRNYHGSATIHDVEKTAANLATPTQRMLARALDFGLLALVFGVIELVLTQQYSFNPLERIAQPEESVTGTVLAVAGIVGWPVYHVLGYFFLQATPGKFALGLKVIPERGPEKLIFVQTVNRSMVHVAEAVWTLILLGSYEIAEGDPQNVTEVDFNSGSVLFLADQLFTLAIAGIGLVSLIFLFDAKRKHKTIMDSYARTIVVASKN